MKELIIGSGLVGTRVAELHKPHYSVVSADKIVAENTEEEVAIDITDKENVATVLDKVKPDVVINFAAITDVDKSETERNNETGVVWKVNVEGTRNVVKACKTMGIRLVQIGTDYEYPSQGNGNYSETDAPMQSPDEGTWYGWTKYVGTKLVLDTLGDRAMVIRIAYPFRAQFAPKLDFARKIIKQLREGTLYPMFDDQFTSRVFIDDIAEALRSLLDAKEYGVWHIVGTGSHSAYDDAREIASVFDFDPETVKRGKLEAYWAKQEDQQMARLRYPKNSTLNAEKINTFLLQQGKAQMHTLKESLEIIKEQGVDV